VQFETKNMWRAGTILRSNNRHLLNHVLASSTKVMGGFRTPQSARSFASSRRFDPDAEAAASGDITSSDRFAARMFAASDMEDHDEEQEHEESGEADQDGHELKDEDSKKRKEAIQKELDERTGREWTDPWKISEEQWMSTTALEDLPDWSPEYVSRISQERVQLYPGT
jgi:hypothetical protein